jgi:putative nucleotidyltransferase with HDIG domain
MVKEELRRYIYSRIDELPTLPVVVSKVLALLQDPNVDTGALARLISRDPALAAKILKVANSAYYGFSRQIDNVRHGTALLGLKMVQSLAVSIGVLDVLPEPQSRPLFSHEGLWRHSVGVAVILQKLGARHASGEAGEYLFMLGLLHDVGKVVLDRFFAEGFENVLQGMEAHPSGKLHEAEQEVIGVDHCEVAAMLLERWRFPPAIAGPIADHHRPAPSAGTSPRDVSLLRVANVLAQTVGFGAEGNAAPNLLRPTDLEILGLDDEGLDAMRGFAESARDDVDAFFRALTSRGTPPATSRRRG